jgi:hypothetical protein
MAVQAARMVNEQTLTNVANTMASTTNSGLSTNKPPRSTHQEHTPPSIWFSGSRDTSPEVGESFSEAPTGPIIDLNASPAPESSGAKEVTKAHDAGHRPSPQHVRRKPRSCPTRPVWRSKNWVSLVWGTWCFKLRLNSRLPTYKNRSTWFVVGRQSNMAPSGKIFMRHGPTMKGRNKISWISRVAPQVLQANQNDWGE